MINGQSVTQEEWDARVGAAGAKEALPPEDMAVNKASFQMPAGVAAPWQNIANAQLGWGPSSQNQDAARAQQNQMRGREDEALDRFRALAQGQDSVVARQAALAREQGRRDIASQLASAGGGYDPAAVRQAQSAQAGMTQNTAMQQAMGQAQERQAALGQYMQGSQMARGQDLQSQQLEMQDMVRSGNLGIAQRELQARFLGLGLTDKQAQYAALMELERLKAAVATGDKNLAFQQGESNWNKGMQIGSTILGTLGPVAQQLDGGGSSGSNG
jgi:hypothetical protein